MSEHIDTMSRWAGVAEAAVRAALVRSRVVPDALAIACPTCGAEAGVSCARSILAACGERVRRSVLARAAA